MIIYWHKTGPLLVYQNGVLHIEDLNPELKTKWALTRLERFGIGIRFLLSVFK